MQRQRYSQVHEALSNMQVENMEEILALMINLIDKLGYALSQAGLLVHLDLVIWKVLETGLDTHCLKGVKIEYVRGSTLPLKDCMSIKNDLK